MAAPEAHAAYGPSPYAATVQTAPVAAALPRVLAELSRAVLASTVHRIRRGEGALLAVNLSLIVHQSASLSRSVAQAVVSVLAIGAMYAFNDLYDAPCDWNNPKKDRALIKLYVEHRRAGILAAFVLKVVTLFIAFMVLGSVAGGAVLAVMIVNLLYSIVFKGVPVADVAWVWLWGALYASIVGGPPRLLVLVGLMTAVCHLFQALDDRVPDAASGVRTTAVRSPVLARNVLIVLSVLVSITLRGPIGATAALTAFTPLALFFAVANPGIAWLLTKAYFGLVWLYLLGLPGAAG